MYICRNRESIFSVAFSLLLIACSISGCGDDTCHGPQTPSVLHVRADGEGRFRNVREAVACAREGDIIELADGVYRGEGNRDIDFLGKAITLRSSSACAEACTIDCAGSEESPHRAFRFHSGEGANSIVEYITIVNGCVDSYGGAILCEDDSSPTLHGLCIADCLAAHHGGGLCLRADSRSVVRSCSFISNVSVGGGGVSCIGGSAHILDCRFEGNLAGLGGGLEVYLPGKDATRVEGCTFFNNRGSNGGAMFFQHVQSMVIDCAISYNSANFGGALSCVDASPILIRCTSFHDTTGASGASMHCQGHCEPQIVSCTFTHGYAEDPGSLVHLTGNSHGVFSRCILSFCENGMAVNCTGSVPATAILSCSNIFGNDRGDWAGCIANQADIQGNISADPLFCDPPNGDLHLRAVSPCGSDSSACGLMGALPVRCW